MEIDNELAAIARRMSEISSGPAIDLAAFDGFVEAVDARSNGAAAPAAARTPRAEIERLVKLSAADYGVDPALIEAIIERESAFDSHATSSRRRARTDAADAPDGARSRRYGLVRCGAERCARNALPSKFAGPFR